MEQVIRNEVSTSQILGYNLGVKLIRGAYMSEERAFAQENNYESPVWDSIEETHSCYNNVMNHVIDNIKPQSRCIVASHNVESCDMARERMIANNITDYRVRFG
jgi:proline dehydrogenase|tara:strand:- start:301 stop:612 length:312 start_codon:yes stop_codon:yes gene_type:complete